MKERIEIVTGDITRMPVDAIVNAANESLLGGGGVDGAIHRAAGPLLLEACRKIGGCPTGEARTTPGFSLPAAYIIHTVGPIWQGGSFGESALLEAAYTHSLLEAQKAGARTVAFPAISTGAYGFPKEAAADIAVASVCAFLQRHSLPEKVFFVCFSAESAAHHAAAVEKEWARGQKGNT